MYTLNQAREKWLNASNIPCSACVVALYVSLYVPSPCEKIVTGRDHLGETEAIRRNVSTNLPT